MNRIRAPKLLVIPLVCIVALVIFLLRSGDNDFNSTQPLVPLKQEVDPVPTIESVPLKGTVESLPELENFASSMESAIERPFIIECINPIEETDHSQDIVEGDWQEAQALKLLQLENQLNQVPSIDTNLALAMLLYPPDSVDYLNRVLEVDPHNELALMFGLKTCTQNSEFCATELFEAAQSSLSSNGYYWLLVAHLRLHEGEEFRALEAIRQAAYASTFDEYYAETIDLFGRTMPLEYDLDDEYSQLSYIPEDAIRFITGIGYAAAQSIPSYTNLTNYCREQGEERADVADACNRLGVQMSENGKVLVTNAIGYVLRERFHEINGDESALELVVREKENMQPDNDLLNKATTLAFLDSNLLSFWHEGLRVAGEKAAMDLIIEEAVRLSANPDYNPCPFGAVNRE